MKCLLCNKDIQKTITNQLRSGEKGDVCYCENCQLGMLEDKHSEAELKEFYDKDYRNESKPKLDKVSNPEELFNIYSNFQEERINLIKRFLKPESRLLEIGCSSGMFLFQIKKYVKDIVGIDYDSNSAQFASEKCGCPVYDVDIEKTDLEEESFDVICLFQTVEHLKNPQEFLGKIKKYLKPGGIIYIEVPNLQDALIHAYNLPNHYNFYFHSAHLWYFTENSLNILMNKVGFNGQIFFNQDYNILNHMHWLSVDAPQPTCLSGLSLPNFPLRNNLDSNKKEKLNYFIKRVDEEYKKLLAELKITSNISFIGKKI